MEWMSVTVLFWLFSDISVSTSAELQRRFLKLLTEAKQHRQRRTVVPHKLQKRKVPIENELLFYELVNKIDPEKLKILMPNITEEEGYVPPTPSNHCCLNGGTCHVPTYRSKDRWCDCPPNFFGQYCELDVDECLSSAACSEYQICRNIYGSYECYCKNGFVEEAGECISETNCYEDPCLNFSSCVDLEKGRIQCLCLLGYTGSRCERKIPECDDSSCSADETCIAIPEGFQCEQI